MGSYSSTTSFFYLLLLLWGTSLHVPGGEGCFKVKLIDLIPPVNETNTKSIRNVDLLNRPLYYGDSIRELVSLCNNSTPLSEKELTDNFTLNSELSPCTVPNNVWNATAQNSTIVYVNLNNLEFFLLREAQELADKHQMSLKEPLNWKTYVAIGMFLIPVGMATYLVIVGHYKFTGPVAQGLKYNLFKFMGFRVLPLPPKTKQDKKRLDPTKKHLRCKYKSQAAMDEIDLDPSKIKIAKGAFRFKFRHRLDWSKLIDEMPPDKMEEKSRMYTTPWGFQFEPRMIRYD